MSAGHRCDGDDSSESGGSWNEWDGDEEGDTGGFDGAPALCLFCDEKKLSAKEVLTHCAETHGFDFPELQKQMKWEFYEAIKVINYIRKQVAARRCLSCAESFEAVPSLLSHMSEAQHFQLPPLDASTGQPKWDSEAFLLPVIDGDRLLFELTGDDMDGDLDEGGASGSSAARKGDEDRGHDGGDEAAHKWPSAGTIVTAAEADSVATVEALRAQMTALQLENEDLRMELAVVKGGGVALLQGAAEGAEQEVLGGQTQDALYRGNMAEPASGEGPGSGSEGDEGLRGSGPPVPGPDGSAELGQVSSPARQFRQKKKVSFSQVAEREKQSVDQHYFKSYSGFGIHREMLGDKVRTGSYESAITKNPVLFRGATVLDVGAGTGILSLFAARGGAAKVVAVDGSSKMVSVGIQIAADNGLLAASQLPTGPGSISDGTGKVGGEEKLLVEAPGPVAGDANGRRSGGGPLTFVAGRLEDLGPGELQLEEGAVDVIVSEWMGYCLLYESMLATVLHARDRWLKPGGAVLPDIAVMHIAGFGEEATSLPFWDDVYGFNYSSVGREVHGDAAQKPVVDVVPASALLTRVHELHRFDLMQMNLDDQDFTASFHLDTELGNRDGENAPCYGIVLSFDTEFSSRFCSDQPVTLSTSPMGPPTHWAQTLLTFAKPIYIAQRDPRLIVGVPLEGDVGTERAPAAAVAGRLSIARSTRHRSIDISLEVQAIGWDGTCVKRPIQMFDM